MSSKTKVTLLAGGVGGAKMAEGFAALETVDLSVIGNVADDDQFHGLWVSPDIDTLTYSLAGLINRTQGWGVADESLRALDVLNTLGAETWMTLGDRDFGLHIYRTERLSLGHRPSEIASDVAEKFGVGPKIILPTDDRVQTRVRTGAGWLSFQEYFVRQQCKPDVLALEYRGIEQAKPTAEALEAISGADLIVIAPSNPLVSIAPILGISGLSNALKQVAAPVMAVSPLIAGKVVKGPADRMMASLGLRADVVGIAKFYKEFVSTLFIDTADTPHSDAISELGLGVITTDIMMPDTGAKERLAKEILHFFQSPKQASAA